MGVAVVVDDVEAMVAVAAAATIRALVKVLAAMREESANILCDFL